MDRTTETFVAVLQALTIGLFVGFLVGWLVFG